MTQALTLLTNSVEEGSLQTFLAVRNCAQICLDNRVDVAQSTHKGLESHTCVHVYTRRVIILLLK